MNRTAALRQTERREIGSAPRSVSGSARLQFLFVSCASLTPQNTAVPISPIISTIKRVAPMRACVRACVRACMRARARAGVRACVRAYNGARYRDGASFSAQNWPSSNW